MVRTLFEGPPQPVSLPCHICGELMEVDWLWYELGKRWMLGQRCHDHCISAAETRPATATARTPRDLRSLDFEPCMFKDQAALHRAFDWRPGAHHILALSGVEGVGKSRLMWSVIDKLMAKGVAKRVDHYLFADLITDWERNKISDIKRSRCCFVDNIGCVESFGQVRASLQAAIRSRIGNNQLTFLTIDNIDFDKGWEQLFPGRVDEIRVCSS